MAIKKWLFTSKQGSELRLKQLGHEQKESKILETNGFTVYSPTVVCDRIAIKDGKVYFIKFKKQGQKLRKGQQAVFDLVPEMYIIQYS